jgi:hypothetical protein
MWVDRDNQPTVTNADDEQNIMFPQLGAAGTAYARSVNTNVLRQGALPDPNLVYDSVMKRTEYKKHPNNVSSVLWYWASIIIHGELRYFEMSGVGF